MIIANKTCNICFFIIWSLYGYGSIPIFIAFLGGYSHPAINPAMTWGEPGTVPGCHDPSNGSGPGCGGGNRCRDRPPRRLEGDAVGRI